MKANDILVHLRSPALEMTHEQINEAWAILKQRFNNLTQAAAQSFMPGDKVEFDARGGRWGGQTIKGVVSKINVKSVGVKAENGVNWKVSPALLRKAA